MKPFQPHPKECAVCGKLFPPRSSTARVCSLPCARKMVKKDRAAAKVALKERKQALKTIPQLIREAQVEFNKWVRMRDAAQPCISCGKPFADSGAFHAGRDAGHYRSTGSASHLRFHEDNCHAQCVKCNQWGAGMVVDYRIRLIERIGLERVAALETSNQPNKWTREELIAIRDEYRARCKQLQKEKA